MLTSLDEETHTLCFLYRLQPGSARPLCSIVHAWSHIAIRSTASRSFGPHVAKMAGVPTSIVERAIGVSADFEKTVRARQQLMRSDERLSLALQADAAWLMRKAREGFEARPATDLLLTLYGMRRHVQASQEGH